jgi:hemerythrin-like domain-containing protein
MTETLTTGPRPDTDDMKPVHQVFRDVFSAASRLVETVPVRDTARAAVVGTLFANVLAFLHSHHTGEDELVWPLLSVRCGDVAAEVERIAAQHAELDPEMQRSQILLDQWVVTPDPALGTALTAALVQLRDVLVAHLDEEEQVVLPLAAQHLTVEEWGALPAHGMKIFTGDKLWLILGLLRDRMSAEQREAQLAHMPPPVVQWWQGEGEPAYLAFSEQLAAIAEV